MIKLHAQPYDLDASGFYFETAEEYETKQAANFNRYGQHVEEYEIQIIDGNDDVFTFNKIIPVEQCNLEEWFEAIEEFEGFDDDKKIAIAYLMDIIGKSYADALEAAEGVYIHEGTKEDYAYDFIQETGALDSLPESLRGYFDYDGLAQDLEINGDIYEISRELIVTNHSQH
jgi:hypothetical protein